MRIILLISFCLAGFLLGQTPAAVKHSETGLPAESSERQSISSSKPPGFGLAQKQFLEEKEIPQNIRAVLGKSVERVCACVVRVDTCITVFSVKKKGVFLTNEHAIRVLLQMREGNRKEKRKCASDFVTLNPTGQTVPLQLEVIKRGKYQPSKGKGREEWDPKTYYDGKADTHDDHTEDLATVRLSGAGETEPIPMADVVPRGIKVFHAGYPVSRGADKLTFPVVSDGRVFELGKINGEGDFLGVNGTSGGPVIDGEGKLVGVFWGKQMTWRENLLFRLEPDPFLKKYGYPRERSFFIPLEHVEKFLRDVN